MLTVEERMKQLEKKIKQKEHQHLLKVNLDKKTQEKQDRRRKYILGEILLEYFPDFMRLMPQTTSEANQIEFAEVSQFMSSLAEAINHGKKLDNELSLKNLDQ